MWQSAERKDAAYHRFLRSIYILTVVEVPETTYLARMQTCRGKCFVGLTGAHTFEPIEENLLDRGRVVILTQVHIAMNSY